MDISKLSHGAKLIIGGTIAFLIVSIFNWQEVDISGIASVGRSMWHGWGVLAGLACDRAARLGGDPAREHQRRHAASRRR